MTLFRNCVAYKPKENRIIYAYNKNMIKFCEIFFSIKVPSILTQASLYFSTIQVSRESRSTNQVSIYCNQSKRDMDIRFYGKIAIFPRKKGDAINDRSFWYKSRIIILYTIIDNNSDARLFLTKDRRVLDTGLSLSSPHPHGSTGTVSYITSRLDSKC